ncbi:MAG: cytochrome P450, partial [Bacteroidota bacterium]
MSSVTKKDLRHVPGDWGLPFFGHFFQFVSNATKFYETQKKKYGDIFKIKTPLGMAVVLSGPAANKLILVEEGKFTSNKEAWENTLGE